MFHKMNQELREVHDCGMIGCQGWTEVSLEPEHAEP